MLQYHDKETSSLPRANVELTKDMIDFVMREVVFPAKGEKTIINPAADRVVYKKLA